MRETQRVGKLNELKWQVAALALIVVGFALARGGLLLLMPLGKVLLPVAVLYGGWRIVKKKVMAAAGGAFKDKLEQAMKQMAEQQQQGGAKQGGVIDLCPDCGAYKGPGHKCAKKR